MSAHKGLEWTFDTVASTYEKMRPCYPNELYEDIFSLINLDSTCRAVEVGIGGGQATEPILKTGCNVTAVEYGANFTELCRNKFATYPNFSAVNMKFEEFPYSKNSFDFVYSASAFHWIPEDIGYKKVYDLLKSGGLFARFANHPYKDKGREHLHQAIQAEYAVYMPGSAAPDEYSEEDARTRADIAAAYGFTDIDYKIYHRTRTFTADEYISLLNTYSDHTSLPENVKSEFFSNIKTAINNDGGLITIYDTIDMQIARKA